jgi:hypothetical protein
VLGVVADIIEPDENPAGAVYGTITCGALLAAETGRQESVLRTAAAVAVALVLYGIAHGYAQAVGERLDEAVPMTVARLRRVALHEVSLLRGAAIPLLALVIAGLVGAGDDTSVTAGLVAAAATLVALELIAGLRARLRRWELVAHLVVGAVLGVGILAVRVLLH